MPCCDDLEKALSNLFEAVEILFLTELTLHAAIEMQAMGCKTMLVE